jgi:OmcA/MtrC family decaheme c-type cytochrome
MSAGQPASVSIANLIAGTAGTLVAGADGLFTATLKTAFPAGATLRAIALQGYFTQTVPVLGGSENIGRHTYSVIKEVAGDAARRDVVDTQKCLKCHEFFEGHGGNRVSNVAVCVTCHNPNLSSSGRTITAPNATIVSQLGPDPLVYPEATVNLRDLIHGLHASDFRTTDYKFVRNRSDGLYYNWSEVTFPGVLSDCLTCHKEGTYELPLPAGVLMTTGRTTTGDPAENQATILAARNTVPNATDLATSPVASTCGMCHDGPAARSHMLLNGAVMDATRSAVSAGLGESCDVCHGSGRIADVKEAHASK